MRFPRLGFFRWLGIVVVVLVILHWILGNFGIVFPSIGFSVKSAAKTTPVVVSTPAGLGLAQIQGPVSTTPVPTVTLATPTIPTTTIPSVTTPSAPSTAVPSPTTPGSSSSATTPDLGVAGEGDVCLSQSSTDSSQTLGGGSSSTNNGLSFYFNLNEVVQADTDACFNATVTNHNPFTISQLTLRLDESFDDVNWGWYPRPDNTNAPTVFNDGDNSGYKVVYHDVKPGESISFDGYVMVPDDKGGNHRTCMRLDAWQWTPGMPSLSTPADAPLVSNSDCASYTG